MISKIQRALFDYLAEYLSSFGIPSSFIYDEQMNLVKNFTNAVHHRITNKIPSPYLTRIDDITEYWEEVKLSSPENRKTGTCVGVFSRGPIQKGDFGNHAPIKLSTKTPIDGSIETRPVLYSKIDYTVGLIFDNHTLCDIAEIIFVANLAGLQHSCKIDYHLGITDEKGEEVIVANVPYGITFSQINNLGMINTSNLRELSFGVTIQGPIILPFYNNSYRIDEVKLDIHGFGRTQVINPEVFWETTSEANAHRMHQKIYRNKDNIKNEE